MSDVVADLVDVEENEEQGCTLEIQCDAAGQALSALTVARWLESALTKEYVDKIMTFKLWREYVKGKYIQYAKIRFDATVNCFEAMQQIKNSTICTLKDNLNTYYIQRVTDITCPCGQFKTVTLHPKNFNFIKTKEVRELLRPYGEILSLKHLKTGRIRDGRVKVVMFVPGANCQSLSECDKDRKLYEKIVIEWYKPENGRISKELVQQRWDEYGPNGSRNNAERALTQLAIE